jgi:hypothetical protein
MARRAARIAAILLLALGAAGCASSHTKTRTDFKSGYLDLERDYRKEFASLQSQATAVLGQDLSTQLTVFTKMSAATTKARDRLRALVPPTKLKTLYNRLLAALDSQQAKLRRIDADARRNDDAALNTALSEYATALQNGISLLHQMDDAIGSKTS